MTAENSEINDLAMPALYESTEQVSAKSQKDFFWIRGTEYSALFLGALFGEFSNDFAWGAGPMVALCLFILALVIRVSQSGERAEKRWYDARAAAESIRSASWQYAIGGEAFPVGDVESKGRFLQSLKDVLAAVPGLNIGAATAKNAGVTREMEALRRADQAERVARYNHDRVAIQVRWYSDKAAKNKRRSTQWRWGLIGIESAAILAGLLQVRDVYNFGLLSLFAAGAAGVAAWQQTKNYTTLSEAYAVTSHEVDLVAATIDSPTDEASWAQAVHDAEAAFSREHTMWLTRRQGPKH